MAPNEMIFLGYGKWVRADHIFALVPVEAERRGAGQRTYVYVEGLRDPFVGARTEETILADIHKVERRGRKRQARGAGGGPAQENIPGL